MAVKLAPGNMIDGYTRLVALADEQLGPQAKITCDRGMYWVQVFSDLPAQCLGHNDDHAITLLWEIIHYWHRYWQEQARQIWEQEQPYSQDEWDWLDWWESVRGNSKGTHLTS